MTPVTDIRQFIADERRLRATHDEAYRVEVEARKAHYEAHKALEKALIEAGGWHPDQEVINAAGAPLRLRHIYLDHAGRQLIAHCSRLRKAGGWTVNARDMLILKTLEA
jgi:hypothetical protein